MSRPAYALVFGVGGIIALWVLVSQTRTFTYARVKTTSSQPTLVPGDIIFLSRFIKPEPLSFIAYRAQIEGTGEQTIVFRVCAMEGDVIEMKNDICYVNGKNVDENLTLAHQYRIPRAALRKLERLDETAASNAYMEGDSATASISDQLVLESFPAAVRSMRTYGTPSFFETTNPSWTLENFGPITVPKDSYFTLGDNRGNAYDSRFTGFIDQEHFVATVLGQHGFKKKVK